MRMHEYSSAAFTNGYADYSLLQIVFTGITPRYLPE